MDKKIFNIKSPKKKHEKVEEWVKNREKKKRLTVDLPASLHTDLKLACVKSERSMGDMLSDAINLLLNKDSLN
jgi:hypothetical protein